MTYQIIEQLIEEFPALEGIAIEVKQAYKWAVKNGEDAYDMQGRPDYFIAVNDDDVNYVIESTAKMYKGVFASCASMMMRDFDLASRISQAMEEMEFYTEDGEHFARVIVLYGIIVNMQEEE